METIREIYFKAKFKCPLPVGLETYIVLDEKGVYQFHWLPLDFHNDEKIIKESIKQMSNISKKKGFFAFVHSEKGENFIKENEKAIAQAWKNMVLCNAGYGEKICKN